MAIVFAVVYNTAVKVLIDETFSVVVTDGAGLGVPGATGEGGTTEGGAYRVAQASATVPRQEGQ